MEQLQATIEAAFERRAELTPRNVEAGLKESIAQVIHLLDAGKLRVAEKISGEWVTHQWIKKAVLLSFRIEDNNFIKGDSRIILIRFPQNLLIIVPVIFAMVGFVSFLPQPFGKALLLRIMWC